MNTESQIEIVSLSPVAEWTYQFPMEKCTICMEKLVGKCVKCLDSHNICANECPISLGKCGHAFHYHCIDKWIKEKQGFGDCPIDKTPWDFRSSDVNTDNVLSKRLK